MTLEFEQLDADASLAAQNGQNGSKPGGKPSIPSVEDLVLQDMGEKFNPLREMMTFPSNVEGAIPRAVVTKDEAVDILRSFMSHQLMDKGRWTFSELVWLKLALSTAIDGRARDEAVQMYSGVGGFVKKMKEAGGKFGLGKGHKQDAVEP